MIYKFVIEGRIPSKKNSRIQIPVRKRVVNIPSKKYREWHKDASLQLQINYAKGSPKEPLSGFGAVLIFYAPDARKADLTNKAESVMDLLVDNKIIKDDSWFEAADIHLRFAGIDRDRPRVEIELLI